MRKIILSLILNTTIVLSCTTFVLKNENNLLFGRNLDWYSENGLVVVNQREQIKQSIVFPPDNPVSWISKYGSITFNQFGKELPFGGINEKGLVIEIMVSKAQYPKIDKRGAVNELQWVQYQLDNASNVDEVIANDKIIRVQKVSQELHFLVADKNGDVAVVEFINGEMMVYKDSQLPIPVLENDSYKTSLKKYKNGTNSRFLKAAKRVKNYKPQKNSSIIAYSFDILKTVALDGSWSIVYDIKNLKISFKTATNKKIKTITLNSFDFKCNNQTLVYDLEKENSGNIDKKFEKLYHKLNTEKIKDAISKGKIKLPENIKELFYKYYLTTKCK
ncbi:linear amide C-N hydrolase [bacterium]|nr:linear amide C-N hydrolase [bacterium]